MKKNIFCIYMFLCSFFISAYSQTVKIGNEFFPVSFEDTSLDVNLQTNIVQDLNRYFAYTKSFDYDFPSYKIERGKRLFYHGRPVSRCVFTNFLASVEGNSTNFIIKTQLSEFYKTQYIMLANSGIPNAFQTATDFVNSLHTGSITNMPVSYQAQFIVANPHKNHPVISDEERINALKGWLKRDYYPVSIAAFHKGKLWGNDDEDRYFCYIRAQRRVQSIYNPVSTLAIVYYNNRWSLVAVEFE
ncbi:MAG: hypothetical protein J6V70_01590 [Kiritimatiellae bacterium]|nr:hypothetical protein [Kiritimatiellia bacterium]